MANNNKDDNNNFNNDQSNDFTDDPANDAAGLEQPVDPEGFSSEAAPAAKQPGIKEKLADAWENNPLLKLLAIMAAVALLAAGLIWLFSSTKQPDQSVAETPDLREAPGGKATPAFLEALKQDALQKAQNAERTGGSAMPTPGGAAEPLPAEEDKDKQTQDMLMAFRNELESMKTQQQQQAQTIQQQLVQNQQRIEEKPFDDGLMRQMMEQMGQLTAAWQPKPMLLVSGVAEKEVATATPPGAATQAPIEDAQILVQAGTVNYAQMLTEANSDVPGPILAQILSGPFAGGRAVGTFEYFEEYLILRFKLISFKGKDYIVDALALDPDTTLGAVATEVDHRYFTRIVLPAAAQFVSGFTSALAQSSDRTVINGDIVFQERASNSLEKGIYKGINAAGQSVSQYLLQKAQKTKTLVRVAVGSPIGFFFVTSVTNKSDNGGKPITSTDAGLNTPPPAAAATVSNYPSTGSYGTAPDAGSAPTYYGGGYYGTGTAPSTQDATTINPR